MYIKYMYPLLIKNLLECRDTFFCVLKAFPDKSKNNAFLKIILTHRKKTSNYNVHVVIHQNKILNSKTYIHFFEIVINQRNFPF